MIAQRMGELLVKERLVTSTVLERCLRLQKEQRRSLPEILIAESIVDEQTLLEFFAKNYKLTVLDVTHVAADRDIEALVPGEFCAKHNVLPVGKRGETLVIATSDPTNVQVIDELKFRTRMRIEFVLATASSLRSVIERNYGVELSKLAESVGSDAAAEAEFADVLDPNAADSNDGASADDAPIIQFVSSILIDATRKGVSDIHIEPYENDLRVRFRLDGDLFEAVKPPKNIKNALIARIKVMANMRIDEKRLPQDGRVRFRLAEGKKVDFRVNTLPTIFGEKVVLRILDQSNAIMSLEQLGFEKDELEKFKHNINAPWGMCLVTGATGSGKTTTLYAALNTINNPTVNISTIEDPVEYNFKGINQVQVKEGIGLTFAETLRALLRQDPDVILLGEIRDTETAEIALKAALTGHMVLSTLHTNDAPSTIMRLKDMNIEPFLINSAVRVIVAQRLIKTNCSACRAPDPAATPETLKSLGFPESSIGKFKPMKGTGCTTCRGTGYKGRAAIHEVLVLGDRVKEVIGQGGNTDEIRKIAIKEGMRTLKANAMRKVVRGDVSLEELATLGDS
ncbi:MAG TPA: type IV-A pilus assembly ATPase PilB [Bdellovibrionota bacterium]|nr:type IV-A pilus assembly ATPase PilB [Bdellovibrionota bacterium]